MANSKSPGRLYLLPLPISSSPLEGQIVQGQKSILNSLSYFLAENIRTSRRFISALKLGITIEDLHFEEFGKRTGPADIHRLLKPLWQGHDMGLMSEAGLPALADPGAELVAKAHERGARVVPLVGPSSIPLAVAASGLGGQQFAFLGYCPVKPEALRAWIKGLVTEVEKTGRTLVFMDTPYRNDKLLDALLNHLPLAMHLCIAKDITGPEEWIRTKTVGDWKKTERPTLHKVPCLFCLGS